MEVETIPDTNELSKAVVVIVLLLASFEQTLRLNLTILQFLSLLTLQSLVSALLVDIVYLLEAVELVVRDVYCIQSAIDVVSLSQRVVQQQPEDKEDRADEMHDTLDLFH